MNDLEDSLAKPICSTESVFCQRLSANETTPAWAGSPLQWQHMVLYIWVNIGFGNDLVTEGTKPLSEPMLDHHQ